MHMCSDADENVSALNMKIKIWNIIWLNKCDIHIQNDVAMACIKGRQILKIMNKSDDNMLLNVVYSDKHETDWAQDISSYDTLFHRIQVMILHAVLHYWHGRCFKLHIIFHITTSTNKQQ